MARAYPDLLTPCYKNGKAWQPDLPNNSESEILNPMRNETFAFMKELFAEFKETFKDEFIHLGMRMAQELIQIFKNLTNNWILSFSLSLHAGMDEVFYACWKSSPEIAKFMAAHGMKEHHELEEYYVEKTLENVKQLGYKSIIWQDPVDNGVKVNSSSSTVNSR